MLQRVIQDSQMQFGGEGQKQSQNQVLNYNHSKTNVASLALRNNDTPDLTFNRIDQ